MPRIAKKRRGRPPKSAVQVAPVAGMGADEICKLIDHAKKQGVTYFKGPSGLEFAFRRQSAPEQAPLRRLAPEIDNPIP